MLTLFKKASVPLCVTEGSFSLTVPCQTFENQLFKQPENPRGVGHFFRGIAGCEHDAVSIFIVYQYVGTRWSGVLAYHCKTAGGRQTGVVKRVESSLGGIKIFLSTIFQATRLHNHVAAAADSCAQLVLVDQP